MASETKRKYERIDPDKCKPWDQPPPIIYGEKGKVLDRREYDKWYSKHRRDYSKEHWKDKNARYERYSREYWVGYCVENDLDPMKWKEVKKRVEHEKWVKQQRARRGW